MMLKHDAPTFTVSDIRDILHTAEHAGWITEDQVARLSGLVIAQVILKGGTHAHST